MIAKILSKLRKTVNYIIKYGKGINQIGNDKPVAFLDLLELSFNRRIFLIVTILVRAGFRVNIRLGIKRYLRWNKYGSMVLQYSGVYPVRKKAFRYDLLVTDNPNYSEEEKKTLFIRYGSINLDEAEIKKSLYFPIMQHPNLLKKEMDGEVLIPSVFPKRDMKIFFAGNISKESYDKSHFQERYRIDNRYVLVQAMLDAPDLSGRISLYSDYSQFRKDLDSGILSDRVVIFDASAGRIPQDQWMHLMARSQYFLALPGYSQPFCHNIVEAMMSGTVPVTEYHKLFIPPLKNESECLAFSGSEDLVVKVLSILNGEYDVKLEKMQEQSRQYYAEYLSLDTAAAGVNNFMEQEQISNKLILAGAI